MKDRCRTEYPYHAEFWSSTGLCALHPGNANLLIGGQRFVAQNANREIGVPGTPTIRFVRGSFRNLEQDFLALVYIIIIFTGEI
jgi:hypothetical protein